jgi:formate hydrogenlyase subunit 3/multisubunit Na+/H+ antiporter MnhD subunit
MDLQCRRLEKVDCVLEIFLGVSLGLLGLPGLVGFWSEAVQWQSPETTSTLV